MAEGANSSNSEFDYPDAWKPSPGDVLKGEIVEITQYSGGGFGAYPIVTVEQEDGTRLAWHAYHQAARSQLAELEVQPGESIAALYKGKVAKRSGDGTYEGYRVKRLNQEAQRFDWGAERAEAAEFEAADAVSPHEPFEQPASPDRPDESGKEESVPF